MWVEYCDITEFASAGNALFVGRERGEFRTERELVPLAIRTTRFFRYLEGVGWRQVHHHGSIDDAALLSRYYLRRTRKKANKNKEGGARAQATTRTRGKAGNGFYPILNELGIHNRVSPTLAGEISRLVASGTFEDAQTVLEARGVRLNFKVVRRVAMAMADRALSYRDWCVEQAQKLRPQEGATGKRIGILTDGGRLRIREVRRQGRPRKSGHRGFDADWREPKVFVIYELDEEGRKKKKGLLRYDGTLGDADRLFQLLAAELIRLGADKATEWVILGDGGAWIWNRVAELVRQVGIAPDRVTEVLDFFHASQHVQEAAEALGGTPEEIQANKAKAPRPVRRRRGPAGLART